ncbi:MAG: heavy metal translocating P-type ATPase [Spirochaetota bacterium]
MLVEVGIVASIYLGWRTFGGKRSPNKYISPPADTLAEAPLVKNAEKRADHHMKTSVALLGIAGIRNYLFPPIAPLFLGVLIYNNIPLYQRTERVLRKEKKLGHDVFITIASFLALATGQYIGMSLGAVFYYLGDKLIAKNKKQSKRILTNAFAHLPDKVWVVREKVEVEIPLSELQANEVIVVTTGEMIAIDGLVVEGMAMIDQQALTGESPPVEKGVGEEVFASTLVLAGRILVRAQKTGLESTAFKIQQILQESAHTQTGLGLYGEKLSHRAAPYFLGLSLLTLLLAGSNAALIVLLSSFGDTIKVLAPLGTLNHLRLAAKRGVFIKKGTALETLQEVDTLLFDKTGTLTREQPEVLQIITCYEYGELEVLAFAATAEAKVVHPIAKAIVSKAKELKLDLPNIQDSQYKLGYGVTITLADRVIRVGSARFMESEQIAIPEKISKAMAESHEMGNSMVFVASKKNLIGAIVLQTVVRPEAKQILQELRQHGSKHMAIVSGDQEKPTQKLAEDLGMDEYFYEILPENKAELVKQLQAEGRKVAFIGDGINDTIAMNQADVSISFSGASSIATDVAQVVLLDGTLKNVSYLFKLSQKLEKNLKTNFAINMAPVVANLTGAFFFNMSYTAALLLKNAIFFMGMGQAMLPGEKLEKEHRPK